MKRRSLFPWVAASIVIGCLAPPPPFEVTLRVSPTPALIGPTRLLIDVADAAGDPVAGASVSVEGFPDQRSNRTATRGIATDEGAGRYVVPAFDLDVRGSWTIAVTVMDSTGASLTRAFPISVFGGSSSALPGLSRTRPVKGTATPRDQRESSPVGGSGGL